MGTSFLCILAVLNTIQEFGPFFYTLRAVFTQNILHYRWATLYMVCKDPKTGELMPGSTSCSMCRRLIINAGIEKVVIRDTPTKYRVVDVQREWIDEDDSLPENAAH